MGERLLCKQEVIGSIPFTSTNKFAARIYEMKWGTVLDNVCKSDVLAEPRTTCESFIGKPMACL